MPLSGTFDVLDFSGVLRLVARQALTGRLHVRSRSYGANLFFEEGQVVGADQSEHQAAAAAGDVRSRAEEICFELLDAERGGFEFQPGKPSSVASQVHLKVDSLLSRARKRLDEWHELQTLIPTLDLMPHLVVDLDRNEVTIDRERWRLLTAVDGRRNLRAIGRALNLSDFDVCRVIRLLIEEGIVELDGRAAAMALAAVGPDAEFPPLTETVTTINGKQAVKAASPAQAEDRARQRNVELAAFREARSGTAAGSRDGGAGEGEGAVASTAGDGTAGESVAAQAGESVAAQAGESVAAQAGESVAALAGVAASDDTPGDGTGAGTSSHTDAGTSSRTDGGSGASAEADSGGRPPPPPPPAARSRAAARARSRISPPASGADQARSGEPGLPVTVEPQRAGTAESQPDARLASPPGDGAVTGESPVTTGEATDATDGAVADPSSTTAGPGGPEGESESSKNGGNFANVTDPQAESGRHRRVVRIRSKLPRRTGNEGG